MIATEDGGILMKCDQKLKLEITYSFIKPDNIDKYKYKSKTLQANNRHEKCTRY